MKVGYPDTINNKAYQGEKSPFKMVDKSKADLDKDGKVSDYEENRAEAAFGSEAPLNYSPLQAREMSDKRRARRRKRVDKIEAKANSIAEQKYTEGVADEDLPSTAKKGKVKKYNRLTKKADRISEKTTKILRKNNQVPSAKKKKSPVKSRDALGTRIYEGPGNPSSTVKKDGGMSSMNNNNFKPTTTTKKTVTPETPETPTTNNRTATKTTRIVKGKGGPKMSTLGVEIYKGIGRLVKKRKAKRAAKKVDKDTPGTEANLRAMVKKNEKYQKANPPSSRKKKGESPAKFVSAAQRKAVWASKNEKKKK